MKLLKKALFFLLTIILVTLVLLLFAKKNYMFEQTTSIENSASEVYNYLKFLKNQEKFNDWYRQDPDKKMMYFQEDGTVSSQVQWKSDNTRLLSGKQTIKRLVYPETIQSEIVIDPPYSIIASQDFILNENHGKTLLTWRINIRFPFPYNILILSDDFATSLNESLRLSLLNIRTELEK